MCPDRCWFANIAGRLRSKLRSLSSSIGSGKGTKDYQGQYATKDLSDVGAFHDSHHRTRMATRAFEVESHLCYSGCVLCHLELLSASKLSEIFAPEWEFLMLSPVIPRYSQSIRLREIP